MIQTATELQPLDCEAYEVARPFVLDTDRVMFIERRKAATAAEDAKVECWINTTPYGEGD